MYYIYHIFDKKIGVARNLYKRVTLAQGYKPNEYEVLEYSEDIEYISKREIELQKFYGYKVDRKLYKNLFKKMKINATEQTSTFPYHISDLKHELNSLIGFKWDTLYGTFELTEESIEWINKNAVKSMYNDNRTFIYNKAFYETFLVEPMPTEENIFKLIRSWAEDRGIYSKGDSKTQYLKLMEESGELSQALLKNDKLEIIDAIGDMVVVLTNLAHMEGHDIESCIQSAYNVISKRTGKMINGTFVKDKITL